MFISFYKNIDLKINYFTKIIVLVSLMDDITCDWFASECTNSSIFCVSACMTRCTLITST